MTFCPKENIGLAEFLCSLCVYSDYCWDSQEPLNPTIQTPLQSIIHLYTSLIAWDHVSLHSHGEGSSVTGSQEDMWYNPADRWTGDSEDGEKTVLEKGTQSHPTHKWDK